MTNIGLKAISKYNQIKFSTATSDGITSSEIFMT